MPELDFKAHRIDALIVSALPNVRYLSNYSGSNGMVLWTRDSMTLFTDPRYRLQAKGESTCKIRVARGPLHLAVAQSLKRKGIKRIGFEQARMTFETYTSLKEALELGG